MPWWSVIYLVLFLLAVAAGTWLEKRDRDERRLVLALDSVSAIICAYLFAAYWVSGFRQALGASAPVLFVLAAAWQVYETPRGIKKHLADPELSSQEKSWLLPVSVAFFLPAYVVAGVAAFR